MSYSHAPTCHLFDLSGGVMTVAELETYFGRVEQHYGTAHESWRVAVLQWSEGSQQRAQVQDSNGMPVQGITVIYRLADGGEKQEAATGADGWVSFTQPDVARYNVPAEPGPMAIFVKDADSVIRCGEVRVQGGNNRHLDVTFRWGTEKQYSPGTEPPPVDPTPPTDPTEVELWDFVTDPSSPRQITLSEFRALVGGCHRIVVGEDWEIYRLDVKEGPATCLVTVRDSAGNPVPDQTVHWGWPDDEVVGRTDGGGAWGGAMGSGAYYYPDREPCSNTGAAGPHYTFLPNGDRLEGIGMVAGTEHRTVCPWFRPRTSSPKPPDDGAVLTVNVDLKAGMYRLVRI